MTDAEGLASDLTAAVRGEVRFDDGTRALYSTDASNYRHVPIGVVRPADVDDVEAAVACCRRHGAPILPRGAGTSLAGQACNVAVVLDFTSHVNAVLEIDPVRRTALVEPGVVLDRLQERARPHGLMFGPDPATHDRCTLGGMIGNNSCGVHSVLAGTTADNVEELEVLTARGDRFTVRATGDDELDRIIAAGDARAEIHRTLRTLRDRHAPEIRERFPRIPRRVSGYNLERLLSENGFDVARALVGTEGTCVTVLRARVKLVSRPASRALLVLGYPDIFAAADHVPEVLATRPIGLEGMDDAILLRLEAHGHGHGARAALPEGRGWLLAEFGGESDDDAAAAAASAAARLAGGPALGRAVISDPARQRDVWHARESALGASVFVPGKPDAWEGWEDSAVPPERLGTYLRALRRLLDEFGYDTVLYGHFGDGCVHARITFDFGTDEGLLHYREFIDRAADLVVSLGGSLSGEHGDGQSRAHLLPRMFGDTLVGAFRDFKRAWDADGLMNPGKVVDAHGPTDDLRLGPRTTTRPVTTRFAFAQDGGSLARSTLRCVGVGKCRRDGGGVMCPSWMATHEEQHSTRGRARLLFEMLRGEVIRDGWRSEEVKDALDLCLACKGCKRECPVGVDVATYKAEFLSHYHEGRLRPAPAYAFGLLPWWCRLASVAPRLANGVMSSSVTAPLLRRLADVAPERRLPLFATTTLRAGLARRRPASSGGTPIILWPDTFNDHFTPHVGHAAVQVLESAGFAVELPRRPLCCGRPLYDFGMLDRAKRWLLRILDVLRPRLREGILVVGMEPSCIAVFRDEACNLLPHDDDARRLRDQAVTLAELLARRAPSYRPPHVGGRALIQPHCHEASVLDATAERDVLRLAGVDVVTPDAGCCGMAGAFGFRAAHQDVSRACAERALWPAVRAEPETTAVVASGFSCREQVRHGTGREALHLAEVLARAGEAPSATRRLP